MYFNDDEIRRIKDAATGHLLDVAQDFHELKRSGVNYNCDCPRCKAAKKLSISPAKQIFKCFGCNELKGGDSVSFLMSAEGMTFNDALEYLAKNSMSFSINVRPSRNSRQKDEKSSKAAKGIDVDSYCARMLAESGLTFEDVTAKVYKTGDTQSIFEQRTFRPGTIDERGMLTTKEMMSSLNIMIWKECRLSSPGKIIKEGTLVLLKNIIVSDGSFRMPTLIKRVNLTNTNPRVAAVLRSIFRSAYAVSINQRQRYPVSIFRKVKRKRRKHVSTAFPQSQSAVYRISVFTVPFRKTW